MANQNSGKKQSRDVDKLAPGTPGGEDQLRDRNRRQSALDNVMAQMPGYIHPNEKRKARARTKKRLSNQDG